MHRRILVTFLLALSATFLHAQDDDLPPPSSKPKQQEREEKNLPPDEEFRGFKGGKKKVDLSKFIIEPNFVFSVGQGMIDLGLSPYVGYKVWEPKKAKASAGNTGLFVGGGVTYRYTGYRNIPISSLATGNVVGYANANFHTYGGGIFVQYNIWKGLFARAKMEILHRNMADIQGQPIPKNPNNFNDGFYFNRIEKTIPALLIGAGYNLLQSRNFFFPIMISYNVLHPFTPADQRAYSLYRTGLVVQLGFINIF